MRARGPVQLRALLFTRFRRPRRGCASAPPAGLVQFPPSAAGWQSRRLYATDAGSSGAAGLQNNCRYRSQQQQQQQTPSAPAPLSAAEPPPAYMSRQSAASLSSLRPPSAAAAPHIARPTTDLHDRLDARGSPPEKGVAQRTEKSSCTAPPAWPQSVDGTRSGLRTFASRTQTSPPRAHPSSSPVKDMSEAATLSQSAQGSTEGARGRGAGWQAGALSHEGRRDDPGGSASAFGRSSRESSGTAWRPSRSAGGAARNKGRGNARRGQERGHATAEFTLVSSLDINGTAQRDVEQYMQSSGSNPDARSANDAVRVNGGRVTGGRWNSGQTGAHPQLIEFSLKGTNLKLATLEFSAGEHRVTAMGKSSRSKTARALCYMHAAQLIDHYTCTPVGESGEPVAGRHSSSPPPPPLQEAIAARTFSRTPLSGRATGALSSFPAATDTQPPRRDDFASWQEYVSASEQHIRTQQQRSREDALLRYRIPTSTSDVVNRAAAVVERRGGAAARLPCSERSAMQELNNAMRGAGKEIQLTRLRSNVHVAVLTLDSSSATVATGVGANSRTAKSRCALHALCILALLQDAAAGKSSDSSTHGLQLDANRRSSAPPNALIMSLQPRHAKLFSFFRRLFADVAPTMAFSKHGSLYTCRLTLEDVTCVGKGVNRFEAERDAVETALSEMELYDDRLQAINAFIVQFPDITPESIPTAALPMDLRETLKATVDETRQRLGLPELQPRVHDSLGTSKHGQPRGDDDNSDSAGSGGVEGSDASAATTATAVSSTAAGGGTEHVPVRGLHMEERALQEQLADATRRQSQSQYSVRMRERLHAVRGDPLYLSRYHARRSTLAMNSIRTDVVRSVAANRVTIICGTTGCGKTTQVPQYLLDDAIEKGQGGGCNILVTQPRRLTAFSVAERIAHERLSRVGGDIGYIVRLDAKPGRHVTLCTAGVLVQMLSSNPTLAGVTHLIIDEVHERDINCDILLSLGKQLLEVNTDIRLVLMSATMQAGLFEKYFNGAPVISVEGAVYPVDVRFLEDIAASAAAAVPATLPAPVTAANAASCPPSARRAAGRLPAFYSPMFDVVDRHLGEDRGGAHGGRRSRAVLTPLKTDNQLIAFLVYRSVLVDMAGQTAGKSILIFLPGWKEIVAAKQSIETYRPAGAPLLRFHCILLHSTVDTAKQRECFRPAPEGLVKVVLATNIAESGITIDDVAVVIDAGLIKLTSWVSPASGLAGARSASSSNASTYVPLASDDGSGDGDGAPRDAQDDSSTEAEVAPLSGSFTTQLALMYASRANGTQRKGRAGRTQGGVCYRLFTRRTWDALPAFQTPEIHRVPLTHVLLKLLSLGHNAPKASLRTFIEPPSPHHVEVSMALLKSLDAVSSDETLTPLGRYLAHLPCDPRIGKLIMMGAILHCMDSVLTIAAATDVSPFVTSRELTHKVRRKRYLFARGSQSDHISYLNAYNAYCLNGESSEFAWFNHLSVNSMTTISKYKAQYRDILCGSGLIREEDAKSDKTALAPGAAAEHTVTRADGWGASPSAASWQPPASPNASALPPYHGSLYVDSTTLSRDARNIALIKACLCSALFPNIAVLDAGGKTDVTAGSQRKTRSGKLTLRTRTRAHIMPGGDSVCRRLGGPREHGVPDRQELMCRMDANAPPAVPAVFYSFQDVFSLREANKSFLTTVTSISLWALLLFGASETHLRYVPALELCVIDQWLAIRIAPDTFYALHALRHTLHACVWTKYKEPGNSTNNAALDTLRRLSREVLEAPLPEEVGGTLSDSAQRAEVVNPVRQPQSRPQNASADYTAVEDLIDSGRDTDEEEDEMDEESLEDDELF